MTDYKLGPISITMTGSDAIFPHVQDELSSLEVTAAKQSDLHFEFGRELPELTDFVNLPPLQIGRTAYRAQKGKLVYGVARDGRSLRVALKSLPYRFPVERIPPIFIQAINWNYLSPAELKAKDFMYGLFDHLTQLLLLDRGASYVHCSSIEKSGQAVLLMAWGGIGKTSSMLKLISEHGWQFLSDDLGLIDESGTVWRTPKKMQIYGYNLLGDPKLRSALMSGRSPMDRAAWRYREWRYGPQRVRRRVSAEALFGSSKVASSAKLHGVIYLERANVDELTVRPISRDELVRRAAQTLLTELQPIVAHSSAMYSGPYHPVLPEVTTLAGRISEVLTTAFSRVDPMLVRIPVKTEPAELVDFMRRLI